MNVDALAKTTGHGCLLATTAQAFQSFAVVMRRWTMSAVYRGVHNTAVQALLAQSIQGNVLLRQTRQQPPLHWKSAIAMAHAYGNALTSSLATSSPIKAQIARHGNLLLLIAIQPAGSVIAAVLLHLALVLLQITLEISRRLIAEGRQQASHQTPGRAVRHLVHAL